MQPDPVSPVLHVYPKGKTVGDVSTPPAARQMHLCKQKVPKQEPAARLTDGTWRPKDPHIGKGDCIEHLVAHRP